MSTLLLANIGRTPSSKHTRHINVRYFFITDTILKKEVKVVNCPTGEIAADMFTKPLQGSLLKSLEIIS